jgi:hypothetical protein
VPNNSAFLLRFLAQLSSALGDTSTLARASGLVRFLASAQNPSGELPYSVTSRGPDTAHFQCVQYNAFQLIDLVEYHVKTGDHAVLAVVHRLLPFVAAGADPAGGAYYDCAQSGRRVVYHSAARAAALASAGALGPGLGLSPAETQATTVAADRGLGWVLACQRDDGGLPFSVCEYGVLRDRRSYPRNLAMILFHLLLPVGR